MSFLPLLLATWGAAATAGLGDASRCGDAGAGCAAGPEVASVEERSAELLRVELLQTVHSYVATPLASEPPLAAPTGSDAAAPPQVGPDGLPLATGGDMAPPDGQRTGAAPAPGPPFTAPPDTRLIKSTMAVSQRSIDTSWTWKIANLKVADTGEPVPETMCGVPARTTMYLDDGDEFGIHGVFATGVSNDRDGLGGGPTVEQVEDMFTEELGDFSSYSPWMDMHFSFYDADIDWYVDAWSKSGTTFLALTWEAMAWPNTTATHQFYSLIANVPKTMEVFEVVSMTKPTGVTKFQHHDLPRHFFAEADLNKFGRIEGPQPLSVSRTTRDLTRVINFYKEMFDLDPLATDYNSERDEGYVFFQHSGFSPAPVRQVHYWYRGDQHPVRHTTHWLEEQLEAINDKYMVGSGDSCWPVWGDNHYTLKEPVEGFFDNLTARFLAKGYGYKPFRNGWQSVTPSWTPDQENNTFAAYFPLPGGWYMEIHDETVNVPYAEAWAPDYCYTFSCR